MEQVNKFTDMIASFILTFRSTDDFDNELISTLYKTLEDIQILYCDTNVIDKEIAYGLFVLHDNLRGAILSWTNEDKILISEISSRIDRYIEKIFLS
ncbi:hypothetical protein [Escherichia fergusonii]|uniref:Uncharacterized protein n=1 Tax=Escherichia fergusonii (strain ATCC 35469 / DSM 13698 / CCUG 18766 / IAM 14443 / JCM 21226 / LMG 7866 / NBRC 102419 / NCTC 12128 / CDC 0568-73) TaxID=585054 RepID=B7LLP6_ESCF3|nr:hypothetical protein [Escherichia fergusonii]EFL4508111.1 hypothetical protein [Escherichia fergusonii]EFL4515921.1 hypothetical protein [Escherichia fergusonii]EFN0218062.1 hypothetical protein [Escherichia fergusonii]EFO7693837.1 hypothetical protein [Escherichia fergusonii]EGC08667.1 hypothetical protein ERIG_00693 [Escherichia fergusonii B253]